MISLSECYTDNTKVFLIGEEKQRGKKRVFRKKTIEPRIFRKSFNHAEFIGEELCHIRKLRCVHFFLIGEGCFNIRQEVPFLEAYNNGYRIKIGSIDFRDKKENDYIIIIDTYSPNENNFLDIILDLAPTDENRLELLDEIEEMFALDTFMGQTDRYNENICFERDKNTKEIHLSPLFDFEYSLNPIYTEKEIIYGNSLHRFRAKEDYINFIKKYPEFADKLSSYLYIDLLEIIKKSYNSRGLKLPRHVIPYYLTFEKERKNLIREITEPQKQKRK